MTGAWGRGYEGSGVAGGVGVIVTLTKYSKFEFFVGAKETENAE